MIQPWFWISRIARSVRNKIYRHREDGSARTVPTEGIVKGKWRDIVVEEDKDNKNRVNRINYEICVLERLRSKGIWVVGAGPLLQSGSRSTCRLRG
jgi:hypothetical protein